MRRLWRMTPSCPFGIFLFPASPTRTFRIITPRDCLSGMITPPRLFQAAPPANHQACCKNSSAPLGAQARSGVFQGMSEIAVEGDEQHGRRSLHRDAHLVRLIGRVGY